MHSLVTFDVNKIKILAFVFSFIVLGFAYFLWNRAQVRTQGIIGPTEIYNLNEEVASAVVAQLLPELHKLIL